MCIRDSPLGCTNLGIMYWKNELPKDDKHAVKLFERACREGDGGGCRNLGFIYEHGYGDTVRDGSRAAELYQQADKLSRVHYVPFFMQNGMTLIQLFVNG